jgi:hypothetical protein
LALGPVLLFLIFYVERKLLEGGIGCIINAFGMGAVMKSNRTRRTANRGAVLIISMVFVLLFATLAVSLCCMAGSNAQVAGNQRKVDTALYAAQSGLECAKRIIASIDLEMETYTNIVSDSEADTAWATFCSDVPALDSQAFSSQTSFTDTHGSGVQIITGPISFGPSNVSFRLRFYRYNDDPRTIKFEAIGNNNNITRKIGMELKITKDNLLTQYAIASRGRMWLTGDSTIHGNIYSSWDRYDISPFNMTSDSAVEGTINTVLTLDGIENEGAFQLETLDENGHPMDANGNPLGTNYADRYYGPDDEIQGYHEGINYDVHDQTQMAGMDISDYDTTVYYDETRVINGGNGDIPIPYSYQYSGSDEDLASLPPTCGERWRYERFPHNAGDYTTGSGIQRKRYIYKDQTFNNVRLPDNRNALFINCTFNGVLYIDCSQTSTSYTNNVRFDNCTFNGTMVSDTPQYFNWQKNCLYFTGGATFQNDDESEATILAPHFNVNLGNTNPVSGDENVLTGAIVGGIVDVRGNAQVYGTIVSMADTTMYPSGYVTNIGATLDDGGSETTQPGDVGTIDITPAEDKLLPSGISSPVIIKPDPKTYSEGV